MKRVLIALTALVMVMTSFAVMDAEAGLFRNRRSRNCCPQPCCEPAPCCAPAPCACEAPAAPCGCEVAAAPACGCEASACGCHQLSRREMRRARRNGCCVQTCSYQAPACGCEAAAPAAPCGCEGSAPCGCGGEVAPTIIHEGAPAPEAAPEAPSSDSTT